MDGEAARVAASESGDERVQLLTVQAGITQDTSHAQRSLREILHFVQDDCDELPTNALRSFGSSAVHSCSPGIARFAEWSA